MKMDIEGAEHVLLPHMIITGALCLIDVVFTECHNWGSITLGGTTTDNDFAAFFEAQDLRQPNLLST